MGKENKIPSVMVHQNIFELASCLDDGSALLLFRSMCDFVESGDIADFSEVGNARERKMLNVLFSDFKDEALKGFASYKKQRENGNKGQVKKQYMNLGLGKDADFEKLWASCGEDPERARAKIEELSSSGRSSGAGSGLKRAVFP